MLLKIDVNQYNRVIVDDYRIEFVPTMRDGRKVGLTISIGYVSGKNKFIGLVKPYEHFRITTEMRGYKQDIEVTLKGYINYSEDGLGRAMCSFTLDTEVVKEHVTTTIE